MKKCNSCKETKPIENFYKYSGREARRGVCSTCLKIQRQTKQKKLYAEKRRKDYTPKEQKLNNAFLMRSLV